jgi:hypothetical protein
MGEIGSHLMKLGINSEDLQVTQIQNRGEIPWRINLAEKTNLVPNFSPV